MSARTGKPRCSKCGRSLTDPYSIAVGMGPECRGAASKRGRKFPKAKWRVHAGRVVFDGLEKNNGPLPVNTTPDRRAGQHDVDDEEGEDE